MPESKLVALLFDTWEDADRAFAGLDEADALTRHDGGSAPAWTLSHMTAGVDFLINARVRQGSVHPTLGRQFAQFGTTGEADDWPGIQAAVREVRAGLRAYLEPLTDADLERLRFPATGPWPETSLRYILCRAITHHYFHIGEVASKRSRLGHRAGDFPGPLAASL